MDIGCGTGEFLEFCRQKGFVALGIEPNFKAREFAKNTYHLDVKEEDALEKMNSQQFDIITLWHVLEHVSDLNTRMNKIKEVLNPDGVVIIAVPNSGSWDAQYYEKFWAAFDLPRHLYHFDKNSLSNLAQKHGFKIEKFLPMKWDAFYISLLSEKYKTGSSNYVKSFFQGLKSNFIATRKQDNYSSVIIILKNAKNAK